jgi:hypothetical protein
VIWGFVRITTHPSVLSRLLNAKDACGIVRSWLDRPQAGILHPGERHAEFVFGVLEAPGTAGNLTTDADFSRFAGLTWRTPIGR